jgi:AcrR family transcriptional regulator
VGKDLFSTRGYHNVTADEIARGAGVSVGSFYAYFADKRELFLAIVDDYLIRAGAVVTEGVARFSSTGDTDIPSLVTNTIRLLLSAHRQSPRLMKEIVMMGFSEDDVKRRLSKMDDRVTSLIAEALVSTGIAAARADAVAFVVYRASEGVIHQIVLGEGKIDEEAVLAELTALFTVYVERLW